jgi:hypothetical protein
MQRWGIDRVGPVMGRGSAGSVGVWGFSFFLFLLHLFAVFLGQPTTNYDCHCHLHLSFFIVCLEKTHDN